MTDPLKSRLERLGDRVPDGVPDLAPVVRSGRKRGAARMGAIVAASIVTLAVVVTAILALAPDASQETAGLPPDSGYIVDAEVTGYDDAQNHVLIRYSFRWEGDEFPGGRRCTWYFFDEEGNLLGNSDGVRWTSLRPRVPPRTTEITFHTPAASADARCGKRLDRGRWKVSDVYVAEEDFGGVDEWVIHFTMDWVGTKQAGTGLCRFTVYDAARREIHREKFTFSAMEKRTYRSERRFFLKSDGTPDSASMTCETI